MHGVMSEVRTPTSTQEIPLLAEVKDATGVLHIFTYCTYFCWFGDVCITPRPPPRCNWLAATNAFYTGSEKTGGTFLQTVS
jgi:hypothetical protein